MVGNRLRLRALLAALALAAMLLGTAATDAHGRTAWDGSLDLYRSGTFTTQKSWLWCTAAGVQIVRNIVDRETDHTKSGQRRYFEWMRGHNRYDLPLSAGIDPAGWTAGLQHFVDGRYRLVASRTFDSAVRLAVQRMRATNLPVALTVSKGNHGWIMTGFSATADPAATADFTVTSVRVVGPLYGLQSRSYGYDMRPGRSLTIKQLRGFFTPWWYAPTRMVWDGTYVSIQPVPVVKGQIVTSLAITVPKATPTPSAAASPSAAAVVASSPTAQPASFAAPTLVVDPQRVAASSTVVDDPPMASVIAFLLLVGGAVVALTLRARNARGPGPPRSRGNPRNPGSPGSGRSSGGRPSRLVR